MHFELLMWSLHVDEEVMFGNLYIFLNSWSADLFSPEKHCLLAEVQDEMLDLFNHKEEHIDGATFNLAL